MGSIVTLTTIPQKVQTKEYSLCIGWERYEQAELVDDIELEIVKKKSSQKQASGTKIVVENLQTAITRTDINSLLFCLPDEWYVDEWYDEENDMIRSVKLDEFQNNRFRKRGQA
jgi:hypothetical protein